MDEMIKPNPIEESDEFWKSHLIAARDFRGTNKEYCRLNGLDNKIMSLYKIKLGFSKPKGRPKAFVEVKPKVDDGDKLVFQREPKKTLPDAKWLAEFAVTLLSAHLK